MSVGIHNTMSYQKTLQISIGHVAAKVATRRAKYLNGSTSNAGEFDGFKTLLPLTLDVSGTTFQNQTLSQN